jgi:hypothetical protein
MVEIRKQHGITVPRRQFDSASTTGNSPKKRKKRGLSLMEQAGLDFLADLYAEIEAAAADDNLVFTAVILALTRKARLGRFLRR